MDRIMLVDDEPVVLRALEAALDSTDFEIECYSETASALKRLRVTSFDLVLSDYRMPGMDGIAFLTEVSEIQPETMRMIVSGKADIEALLGAINNAGVFRFIIKPWDNEQLRNTIQIALDHRAVLIENRRLADQVREQKQLLGKYKGALEQLEAQEPGITKVQRSEDGAIILDDE